MLYLGEGGADLLKKFQRNVCVVIVQGWHWLDDVHHAQGLFQWDQGGAITPP